MEEVVFVDHGNHLLNKEEADILNVDIDCEEDFADQANNKVKNDPGDATDGLVLDPSDYLCFTSDSYL